MFLFVWVCSLNCGEHAVLEPRGQAIAIVDTLAISQRNTVSGCATFEVAISAGRRRITLDSVAVAGCNGALRPTLDASAPPHIDGATGAITVSIALHNLSERTLTLPTAIRTDLDSIAIIAPIPTDNTKGRCGTGRCVLVERADSVIGIDSRAWRFDSVLASAAHPQILQPGTYSRSRQIVLIARASVRAFRFTLVARGTTGAAVEMRPPNTVPGWVYSDTNFVRRGPAKRLLIVRFRPTATQAQRQRAVDLLGATVIGGRHLGEAEGFYYLWIPADTTEPQLQKDAARLEGLPEVESAALGRPGRAAYLRPHDGSGWQTWQVDRHACSTEQNWALEADAAPLAWGCSTVDTNADQRNHTSPSRSGRSYAATVCAFSPWL